MSRGYYCFRSILSGNHAQKGPVESYEKDIEQIASGSASHLILWLTLKGIVLKLENIS